MASAALDYLDRLLVSRLHVGEARRQTWRAGFAVADVVLHLPRLILVVAGRVSYRLDERQWALAAGDMVLVPAYAHRRWVAVGRAALTMAWFEYRVEPCLPELPELLRARPADTRQEAAALGRIGVLSGSRGEGAALQAEGEMKAMLARFLVQAAPVEARSGPGRTHHADRAVADAARWLARHYALPDAVTQAIDRSRLSVNHFRLVFKQRLGMSPQRYLTQLRMRAARFHLHETQAAVKEVAGRVGYADPFHFSRTYRRFWGHAPTDDRGHR